MLFLLAWACFGAIAATLIIFVLNVWDGVPVAKAANGAALCGSAVFGLAVLAGGGSYALYLAGNGLTQMGRFHYLTATALGLAVTGVFLSFGRTRWRAALCGASTVAGFLSVLAIVHGAGV
ncbi:hypothetical protein MKI84_08475 [Ancylobacter sp. A5.8]|uniref:hypothetical protein n=1 Tax=Ancylobacter gelatini TaxID=2919920 RepID=UPI001F4DFA74|nr:hypothetical protein [Ancylobacter gelatini]MCJ8142950.1 hypothetical protein [Ancylobacter gelatini]